MTPKAHVFVYYRVEADRADVARAMVDALLADVARTTGVAGRWMRREDDPGTWMEVYESVGDASAFVRTLAQLAAECGLEGLLAPGAERHVEHFTELMPCA